jgi:sporulation protein YlmC with PRC-barrel domain
VWAVYLTLKSEVTGRVAMAETPYKIGAECSCTDGACGRVTRVVVDPVARAITHLVVEPRIEHRHGRLVPIDLVATTAGEIRLHCTKAEFEKLDPAEETNLVAGSGHAGYEPDQVLSLPYYGLGGVWSEGHGWDGGGEHATHVRTVTYDSVPLGEVQVRRGDRVHATDGEIGLVEGLVIDPDSHEVTHVLLQAGHLWGRREVSIPISAVTSVETGIRLNMSRQQIEDLPPVPIHHSAR